MPIQQPVDTCWYLFCEQRHQRISLQRCTEATRRREIDSSWPKSGWENKCSASSASSSYTSSSFCIYKLTPKAGHGDFTFSDLFSVFALLGPSLRTTPYKSERCRRWTSWPFTKSIQVLYLSSGPNGSFPPADALQWRLSMRWSSRVAAFGHRPEARNAGNLRHQSVSVGAAADWHGPRSQGNPPDRWEARGG